MGLEQVAQIPVVLPDGRRPVAVEQRVCPEICSAAMPSVRHPYQNYRGMPCRQFQGWQREFPCGVSFCLWCTGYDGIPYARLTFVLRTPGE